MGSSNARPLLRYNLGQVAEGLKGLSLAEVEALALEVHEVELVILGMELTKEDVRFLKRIGVAVN